MVSLVSMALEFQHVIETNFKQLHIGNKLEYFNNYKCEFGIKILKKELIWATDNTFGHLAAIILSYTSMTQK